MRKTPRPENTGDRTRERRRDDPAARIYLLPALARQVLTLSAHWIERTDKPSVHTAATLDPSDIYAALVAGKAVMWQDWSLRASPPRPSREDNGAVQWTPSIWVSSTKGFSPFPRVDPENVSQACRFIAQREARTHAHAQIEFEDEPCY